MIVVMTSRTGKKPPPGILLSIFQGPVKIVAFEQSEKEFRRLNHLEKNIALHSSVLFEGSEEECREFYTELLGETEEVKA